MRGDLPAPAARTLASIRDVDASSWDALFATEYPFLRHDFLRALEDSGCVVRQRGWQPSHLVVQQGGALVAAAPLYLKSHSYGEFVFDWAWAEASQRIGVSYYPKLVCAVPFTPASGPRFAARDAAGRDVLLDALAIATPGASSVHVLFAERVAAEELAGRGFLPRQDLQFHWRNAGFESFDAFLATLTSAKRKKILRERRRVAEAGIRFEVRRGDELAERDWHATYALYANTYEERGQPPYLTLDFFLDFGARAGTPVRLIQAHADGQLVAVAITLVGGDTLYGRHWGAAERYHSLHFETCYYQGIELCIREGLQRFDAGAQGEHKLARGFAPVTTTSLHLLRDERLHAAVAHHLRRERAWVESRRMELEEHAPFRAPPDG